MSEQRLPGSPLDGTSTRLKTNLSCFQYHATVARSDAIGNSIRSLHAMLRRQGIASTMLCADAQLGQSTSGVRPLSWALGLEWQSDDVLLVHYSFHDVELSRVLALPVRKVLVYHNVTPAHFFRGPDMERIADASAASVSQIAGMRDMFEAIVGDSAFNLSELPDLGTSTRVVIPVFYDEATFSAGPSDPSLYFDLKGRGRCNLLFVGRFVPNKRHDQIISTLAELKRLSGRAVTLHLAGKIWSSTYQLDLLLHAAALGVLENIRFYHDAPLRTVQTLFSAADAFVSMSEHEGFMVPVLEAFTAGCPLVANPTTAVGETMGEAGLRIEGGDPALAAALIEVLLLDRTTRMQIIEEQAARAVDFRRLTTFAKWIDLLRRFAPIEEVAL